MFSYIHKKTTQESVLNSFKFATPYRFTYQTTMTKEKKKKKGKFICVNWNAFKQTKATKLGAWGNNSIHMNKLGWAYHNIKQGWPMGLVWNICNKMEKNLCDCHEC
jgi:hypothetical protein